MLTRVFESNNDRSKMYNTVGISNRLGIVEMLSPISSLKLKYLQCFVNNRFQLNYTLTTCFLQRNKWKLQKLPIKDRDEVEESVRVVRFRNFLRECKAKQSKATNSGAQAARSMADTTLNVQTSTGKS